MVLVLLVNILEKTMVDFGITVDVSNLNNKDKMRVQGAFFELGIEWGFFWQTVCTLEQKLLHKFI